MVVKHLVEDGENFLANYSDGLTDAAAGHRAHPRPQVRPRAGPAFRPRKRVKPVHAGNTLCYDPFGATRYLAARGFLAVHGHAARQAGA